MLGADHRARPSVARGWQGGWQVPRVWKPFEGFHHNDNRRASGGAQAFEHGGMCADVEDDGIGLVALAQYLA